MYQPPMFNEERIDVMQMMMKNHPFASLVSMQAGKINADHLPLVVHPELAEKGVLRGHISRANPMSKQLDTSIEVLVMFNGPHHYITPSWYPSKAEHQKVVPTWNYIVVHARGKIKFITDTDWMLAHLNELTKRNEKGRKSPWKVADAPVEFITRQFRGIIGIEIEITDLQGTWKTSQNKSEPDHQGVISGLNAESTERASLMANCVVQGKKTT